MKQPHPTLAEAWQSHADRHLPIDASQAAVIRARRAFYLAEVERLAAIPHRSALEEALFQEGLGFGRTIGTSVEVAA